MRLVGLIAARGGLARGAAALAAGGAALCRGAGQHRPRRGGAGPPHDLFKSAR